MLNNIDYTNDEIIHLKKDNIEYLQFKALLKYAEEITHFFTLRNGGVSKNEFCSLNLGLFTGDSTENLYEGFKLL